MQHEENQLQRVAAVTRYRIFHGYRLTSEKKVDIILQHSNIKPEFMFTLTLYQTLRLLNIDINTHFLFISCFFPPSVSQRVEL